MSLFWQRKLRSSVLPLSEVSFDDPGAAWVRAPLYRLAHVLLLHLAALPDLKEVKVLKERVRECATMLSSVRSSVEVDFAVEEVSALESRLVDIAQQGYRAAGLLIIGAVKSVASQKISSDLVDGLRAAASAGFGQAPPTHVVLIVLKAGEALYQSGRRISVPKTVLHTLFQTLFDVKTPLPLGHKIWDTYIFPAFK